jgi:hypothetical protein
VSQDREAAAIAGINPDRMNMLAFALGGMIAALAGALLVQAFSWLPQVGDPGAAVLRDRRAGRAGFAARRLHRRHHGLGLVEAAGTGCIPTPKAASYIPAYGMIVLTLTLLLRPPACSDAASPAARTGRSDMPSSFQPSRARRSSPSSSPSRWSITGGTTTMSCMS